PMCQRVEQYVSKFQEDIVDAFEKLGPNAPSFKRDSWLRAQGGRPRMEAAPQGTVLEKAGVNISIVHGMLLRPAIKQMRADH
ncbi:Coproporphyrinogen III oxidase, partial [Ganoderma leucocontextum]